MQGRKLSPTHITMHGDMGMKGMSVEMMGGKNIHQLCFMKPRIDHWGFLTHDKDCGY